MSKQYSAKTMYDQSIVYLFNSYIEAGMTPEQASGQVTKDIEEIFNKHRKRSIVAPSNILMNPLTKIDKALNTIHNSRGPANASPNQLIGYYKRVLRSVERDVSEAKQLLEQ